WRRISEMEPKKITQTKWGVKMEWKTGFNTYVVPLVRHLECIPRSLTGSAGSCAGWSGKYFLFGLAQIPFVGQAAVGSWLDGQLALYQIPEPVDDRLGLHPRLLY